MKARNSVVLKLTGIFMILAAAVLLTVCVPKTAYAAKKYTAAFTRENVTKVKTYSRKVINHQFNWWFLISPQKGFFLLAQKGSVASILPGPLKSGTSGIFFPGFFCLILYILLNCAFGNITDCLHIISPGPKCFIPLTL